MSTCHSPARLRAVAALALLVLSACGQDSGVAPNDDPRPNLTVVNDPAALAGRMEAIPAAAVTMSLRSTPDGLMGLSSLDDETEFVEFVPAASVRLPEVNGQRIPATHVLYRNNRAYVSYASVGGNVLGAVDVFDVTNAASPVLLSSASFTTTKVYSMGLSQDGRTLFLGTATNDTGFATPAVVEALALDTQGRLTANSMRVSVPSYAVTGVAARGTEVYATSGTGGALPTGGLTVLDAKTMTIKRSVTLDDARGVVASSSQTLVVTGGGAGGAMHIYEPNGSKRSTVNTGGLQVEGKATVAMSNNWGFVSLGAQGARMIRVSGKIESLLNIDPPSATGLADPADAVTNAIAIADLRPVLSDWTVVPSLIGFVFTADGGAGVRVWVSDYPITPQTGRPELYRIGSLGQNGGLAGSVNMIGASDKSLLVANGMGGLRLFAYGLR